MLNQQLDIDERLHDLAPDNERLRLFESAPQIRGQIAMQTDEPKGDIIMANEELQRARELGKHDGSYARSAASAYSTTGSREVMIGMARRALNIAYDPTPKQVDELADAYYEGRALSSS